MRLGLIWEPQTVNSIYRALVPMKALGERGHEVMWPANEKTGSPIRDLQRCDLVHCFRSFTRYDDLARLSRQGVAISFDNDDDFAASDISSTDGEIRTGLAGRLGNAKKARAIEKAVRLADLATTPSKPLAERYRAIGASDVTVIENHLDASMFGFGHRAKHDGVVIGWVAAREHAPDLAQLPIVESLARLLDEHAELRVLSVGLRLPLRSERYEHREKVDHSELLLTTGAIDIGIAPLADTPFNRARSNVKLKEYASGGAAWLASPVGSYRELGEREGGRLVADERWYDALDELIAGTRKRRRLARRALKWARAQTIGHYAPVWEREFERAIELAATRMREPPSRARAAPSTAARAPRG
jgi:glycosyltransferase involved in cell wall biosynthesis